MQVKLNDDVLMVVFNMIRGPSVAKMRAISNDFRNLFDKRFIKLTKRVVLKNNFEILAQIVNTRNPQKIFS